MLFGFADSTGGEAVNDKLAKDRARTVSGQFEQRGLKAGIVTGFGSHNPGRIQRQRGRPAEEPASRNLGETAAARLVRHFRGAAFYAAYLAAPTVMRRPVWRAGVC